MSRMERAGAQHVHFPALLPREPYEVTGRWTEYGDGIFRLKDRKASEIGDVWRVKPEHADNHPAPFPLQLPTLAIGATNAPTVLDPFMGSGTTLRAAKDLNRKAIGIELSERYCEIAAKRMAQEVLAL